MVTPKAVFFIFFGCLLDCTCNIFGKSHGVITSPGFPAKYTTSNDGWFQRIKVAGNKRIKLVVNVMDLQQNDKLTIYNGYYCSSVLVGNYFIKEYKGKVSNLPDIVFIDGNQACIELGAEKGGTKGFSITIEEIPECLGTYDKAEGDIVSPYYPNSNYRYSTNCRWHISLSLGQKVEYKIRDFDLATSDRCSKTYVILSDAEGHGPNEKLCKPELKGRIIYSKYHESDVIFYSESKMFASLHDTGHGGFWIRYKAIGCKAKELPNDVGSLTNPSAFYNYGFEASFQCPQGERYMNGDNLLYYRCNQNGTWTGRRQTCVETTCGMPVVPADGTVILSRKDKVGSSATYTCNTGFTLEGATIRICLSSGLWSLRAPVCRGLTKTECSMPGDPANGRQVITDTFGHEIGDQVQFQCDKGYDLVGAELLTCLAVGMWDNQRPKCQAKTCDDKLVAPSNGVMFMTSNTYGSDVTYSCDIGYYLEGAERRECTATGKWSGSTPACKVIRCKQPRPPVSGSVNISAFNIGAKAVFDCDRGFELNGPKTVVCLESREWSQDPPFCVAIHCQKPRNITNGNLVTSSFTFGSEAIFLCTAGFFFDKAETINAYKLTCRDNGEWSGKVQDCVYGKAISSSVAVQNSGNSINWSTSHLAVSTGQVSSTPNGFSKPTSSTSPDSLQIASNELSSSVLMSVTTKENMESSCSHVSCRIDLPVSTYPTSPPTTIFKTTQNINGSGFTQNLSKAITTPDSETPNHSSTLPMPLLISPTVTDLQTSEYKLLSFMLAQSSNSPNTQNTETLNPFTPSSTSLTNMAPSISYASETITPTNQPRTLVIDQMAHNTASVESVQYSNTMQTVSILSTQSDLSEGAILPSSTLEENSWSLSLITSYSKVLTSTRLPVAISSFRESKWSHSVASITGDIISSSQQWTPSLPSKFSDSMGSSDMTGLLLATSSIKPNQQETSLLSTTRSLKTTKTSSTYLSTPSLPSKLTRIIEWMSSLPSENSYTIMDYYSTNSNSSTLLTRPSPTLQANLTADSFTSHLEYSKTLSSDGSSLSLSTKIEKGSMLFNFTNSRLTDSKLEPTSTLYTVSPTTSKTPALDLEAKYQTAKYVTNAIVDMIQLTPLSTEMSMAFRPSSSSRLTEGTPTISPLISSLVVVGNEGEKPTVSGQEKVTKKQDDFKLVYIIVAATIVSLLLVSIPIAVCLHRRRKRLCPRPEKDNLLVAQKYEDTSPANDSPSIGSHNSMEDINEGQHSITEGDQGSNDFRFQGQTQGVLHGIPDRPILNTRNDSLVSVPLGSIQNHGTGGFEEDNFGKNGIKGKHAKDFGRKRMYKTYVTHSSSHGSPVQARGTKNSDGKASSVGEGRTFENPMYSASLTPIDVNCEVKSSGFGDSNHLALV